TLLIDDSFPINPGGWPTSHDFPCAPFQPRVPHPCVFCKGGQRCCMRYRIGYDATWINKFVPAFPAPALRKLREERGTRFVGTVKEIKGRAICARGGRQCSLAQLFSGCACSNCSL